MGLRFPPADEDGVDTGAIVAGSRLPPVSAVASNWDMGRVLLRGPSAVLALADPPTDDVTWGLVSGRPDMMLLACWSVVWRDPGMLLLRWRLGRKDVEEENDRRGAWGVVPLPVVVGPVVVVLLLPWLGAVRTPLLKLWGNARASADDLHL